MRTTDAGPQDGPRDAQIDAQLDAGTDADVKPPPEVEPEFDPSACSLTKLAPADVCPAGDCRIAFAGELTCQGWSVDWPEIASGNGDLFLHTYAYTTRPYHVVARVDLDSGELEVAAPVKARNVAAYMRVTPGGEPVVIAADTEAMTVLRATDFPDGWESTVEMVPMVFDTLFDREGRLVVFSTGLGASGQPVTFARTLPDPPVEIFEPGSRQGRAVLLEDGTPALFYVQETTAGRRTLRRWVQGVNSWAELFQLADRMQFVPLFRPIPARDWSAVPTVGLDYVGTTARADGLYEYRLGPNALPLSLLNWSQPTGCDMQELVPYPDICKKDVAEQSGGAQMIAHELALGADGTPFLLALVGDATHVCEWVDVDGCIETRTCNCQQAGQYRYQNLALDVQSRGLIPERFRIPIPGPSHARLAVGPGEDGMILVAVAFGDEPNLKDTHVRYFGLDTR